MADISIRNLDDFVALALKQRAESHGISMEEEIRLTLKESLTGAKRREASEGVKRFRELMRAKYGTFPDSTPDIREERDSM